MPKTNILTQSGYSKLVKDVRRLIEDGRKRASRAATQELVLTYWNVGKRITEEGLSEIAGYGQSVLQDLADDLGLDVSTLKRCIYFFQTYNRAPSSMNLSWSHYKILIPLRNPKERKWYEDLVEHRALSAPQLQKAIKDKQFEESQKAGGKKARAKKLKRPTQSTYLYKAWVENVVDGDTLVLRVDLGFQVSKEQRVRLAGINARAVDTPEGREAFNFVRDQLARVAFVMVKTNKIDIYGRYVGDVFYSFKEKDKDRVFEKGRYLNQELLDRGLADLF